MSSSHQAAAGCPDDLGFVEQKVVDLSGIFESLCEITQPHRHVFHEDLQIEFTLPSAESRVHFAGFGVDEPRLQELVSGGGDIATTLRDTAWPESPYRNRVGRQAPPDGPPEDPTPPSVVAPRTP
jgi:hypothetical protein